MALTVSGRTLYTVLELSEKINVSDYQIEQIDRLVSRGR